MKKDIHLESLVPDLISENIYFNNPKFRQFIEAFLRYLEQRNESTLYINKLVDLRNVDEVLMDFISHLEYELGPSIPANNIGDKALYLKRLKELYISRGTTSSIEAFFKLFYNTLIEIEFPFESVLIPSSGNFDEAQYTNQIVVDSQEFSSTQRVSDNGLYRSTGNEQNYLYNDNHNYELISAIDETIDDIRNLTELSSVSGVGTYVYSDQYVLKNLVDTDTSSALYPYFEIYANNSDGRVAYKRFDRIYIDNSGTTYILFQIQNNSGNVYLKFQDYGTNIFTIYDNYVAEYGSGSVTFRLKIYKRTDDLVIYTGNDIIEASQIPTRTLYPKSEPLKFIQGVEYRMTDSRFSVFSLEDSEGNPYTDGFSYTTGNNNAFAFTPTVDTPRTLYLKVDHYPDYSKEINIVLPNNYEFPTIGQDSRNFDINTARLYVNGQFLPRIEDRRVNWTYDYFGPEETFPGGGNSNYAVSDQEPKLNIRLTTEYTQDDLSYTYTDTISAASVYDAGLAAYLFELETPFYTAAKDSITSVKVNGVSLTYDGTIIYPTGSGDVWNIVSDGGGDPILLNKLYIRVDESSISPVGDNLTIEIQTVAFIELFYTDPDTSTNNFNNYIYNFDALSSDSIIKIGDTTLEKRIDYKTIYREVTRVKQFEFKEKAYTIQIYKNPNTVYDSVTGKYTVEINTPFLINNPAHIIRVEVEFTYTEGNTGIVEIGYNSTIGTDDSWGVDLSVVDNRDKIFMTLLEGTIDPYSMVPDYGAINVTIVYYSEYGEVIEFIQNDPNNSIDLVNGIIGNGTLPLTIAKQMPAYLDNKGFLSNDLIVLQDSYKYQLFSYILKTSISPTLWDNAYKQLINPAGLLYFTEILLIVYGIEGLLESGKILPDFQSGSQQGDIDFVILIPDFNINPNAVPEKFDYKIYADNFSYSGDAGFLYTNSNLIGPYDHFDADKFTSFSGIGEFSDYTIQDAINNNIDVNSLSEITFS